MRVVTVPVVRAHLVGCVSDEFVPDSFFLLFDSGRLYNYTATDNVFTTLAEDAVDVGIDYGQTTVLLRTGDMLDVTSHEATFRMEVYRPPVPIISLHKIRDGEVSWHLTQTGAILGRSRDKGEETILDDMVYVSNNIYAGYRPGDEEYITTPEGAVVQYRAYFLVTNDRTLHLVREDSDELYDIAQYPNVQYASDETGHTTFTPTVLAIVDVTE